MSKVVPQKVVVVVLPLGTTETHVEYGHHKTFEKQI